MSVKLVRRSFFEQRTALCWSCTWATALACAYLAAKNPADGLREVGADAIMLLTKSGPLLKVIRCPKYRRGRLNPFAICPPSGLSPVPANGYSLPLPVLYGLKFRTNRTI